eukprot:2239493-Amphidinium_carterae.1
MCEKGAASGVVKVTGTPAPFNASDALLGAQKEVDALVAKPNIEHTSANTMFPTEKLLGRMQQELDNLTKFDGYEMLDKCYHLEPIHMTWDGWTRWRNGGGMEEE